MILSRFNLILVFVAGFAIRGSFVRALSPFANDVLAIGTAGVQLGLLVISYARYRRARRRFFESRAALAAQLAEWEQDVGVRQ